MKKALITGITGQDGSYLAEFLITKGYEVHGMRRKTSTENRTNFRDLEKFENKNFFLHYGDMNDTTSLLNIILSVKPDEIYNLASQTQVHSSFIVPESTALINANGTLALLEILKTHLSSCKFYQASTSELYGDIINKPQNENTPFNPRSPYAISKLFAYFIVKNFREAYGIFAANGILFNHESPRRGEAFVTRKISQGVANIINKKQEKIYLGNLDAKRDWGFAKDYVEAMWLILQYERPEDFVVATGKQYTVRDFVTKAFQFVDIEINWKGKGLEEKGINIKTGEILVEVDPYYFRPTEVEDLMGDYSKAKDVLNWSPKLEFEDLVKLMVESDLKISSTTNFRP